MAYFANGAEGSILESQCSDCILPDDAPCPILWMQMEWNYDQLENGEETKVSEVMNLLIDEKGYCQMKPLLDKLGD